MVAIRWIEPSGKTALRGSGLLRVGVWSVPCHSLATYLTSELGAILYHVNTLSLRHGKFQDQIPYRCEQLVVHGDVHILVSLNSMVTCHVPPSHFSKHEDLLRTF